MIWPKVSVVIVNLNGKRHIENCLASLHELDYPKDSLQIVFVDNASSDGSIQLLEARGERREGRLKLITNKENVGFAGAVNQGVKEASGDYVVLLNNDMKVDKKWLTELVKPVLADSDLACTGSKVLNWDGTKIDFVSGMMNFEGRGFQVDFEKKHKKTADNKPQDMLFVNGGSMLVRRDVFLEIGGFDEDYFAFYEDVDFGWRTWIAGYRVRYIPTSIAYHRHHGTSSAFGQEKLQLLYERNALFSIYKNYSKPVLDKVLSAALLLLNKRAYMNLGVDKETYRLTHKEKDEALDTKVPKKALSYVLAVDDFITHLPQLREKREKVQALRKRSDEALFKLFGEIFFSIFSGKEYQDAQIDVQHSLGIYDIFLNPKNLKILILTHEVVADKMAGPGIRCWEMAKVLAQEYNVTLGVPNEDPKEHPLFKVRTYQWARDIKDMAEEADVIICQGIILAASPFLTQMDKILVVDIYDPFVLSLLEQHKELDTERRFKECANSLQALRFQLEHGDYFICASEKQKDFWVGVLTALGRINPQTYDSDVTIKNLIDVVPFGIAANAPKKTKKVMKGVIKGISEKDKVVLWGGGIYNWFDPLSLIRAFGLVKQKHPDIKLVFMGVKHPNPNVPEMEMATKAVDLAKELDLYENTVFFNFGWVPYEERANYLLEADMAVSTHFDHIETRFSFRTRMLDSLWAELPSICTKGDAISELVEDKQLGITVAEQDIQGLADAIVKLATENSFYKQCKDNIAEIRSQFTWESAVKPLFDFCQMPTKAADNAGKQKQNLLGQANGSGPPSGPNGYLGKFNQAIRNHGLKAAVKKSINYIRARV